MILPSLSLIIAIILAINLAMLAYRDYRDYILPDILNFSLAILFIIFHISIKWGIISPLNSLVGGISAALFMLIIYYMANKFYKSDSFGLGDVKMIAAAGVGLGIPNVFVALSLGALLGIIHGFVLARIRKQPLSDTQVPAGVGFSIGILATFTYMLISVSL